MTPNDAAADRSVQPTPSPQADRAVWITPTVTQLDVTRSLAGSQSLGDGLSSGTVIG